MSWMNGEVVSERYRIVGPLGQGGMGITYRAVRLGDDAPVAIKTLDLRRAEDWKSVELFEREADALRAIDLPGVPAYLDSFALDDAAGFALVQELAPGESLDHVVAKGGLPIDEVIDIAEQVLATLVGLQAMEPPVSHRDIKPANLVRADDGTIRLVDFGAVKTVWEEAVGEGSTVVGTFGYMAPEQFRGAASRATDLYGLGATLLHCVSGREPSSFPQDRLQLQFRDSVALPDAFASWLERMLAPHEEDRFATADAALSALRAPEATSALEPLPATSLVRVEVDGRSAQLRTRPGGLRRGQSVTLLLFSLIWSAFVGVMLVASLASGGRRGENGLSLVMLLPFAAIGLGMLGSAIHGLTVQARISFDAERWAYRVWSLVWRKRHEGPVSDFISARAGRTGVKINNKHVEAVFLETRTIELKFGQGLTSYERDWIVQWLMEQRARFSPSRPSARHNARQPSRAEAKHTVDEPLFETAER